MGHDLLWRLHWLDRVRNAARRIENLSSNGAALAFFFSARNETAEVVSRALLLVAVIAVLAHGLAVRSTSRAILEFLANNRSEGRLGARLKALRLALIIHWVWLPLNSAATFVCTWLILCGLVIGVAGWGVLGLREQLIAVGSLTCFIAAAVIAARYSVRAKRFHRRWLHASREAGIDIGRTLP